MAWYWIILIAYFVTNLIIAVIVTIIFEGLGYCDSWNSGKTHWGKAILVLFVLMIIAFPLVIVGLIGWLIEE